jgi:hypothetical protein
MQKEHATRTVKLQPELINKRYCATSIVPKLLLKGKWFQSAGFEPGMLVNVIVENGRLIVEACPNTN